MVVIVQRTVEISWKPSYGNYVQMQHGVIPEEFCPWKTAYNRFNRWASKGLWGKFFLNYEAYWIKNGYSLREATYARISMQVELGTVSSEQLDGLEVKEPQNSSCNRREWITD